MREKGGLILKKEGKSFRCLLIFIAAKFPRESVPPAA